MLYYPLFLIIRISDPIRILVRIIQILDFITKGPSLNYVSIFEGGGGIKMLTDAYMGEGGVSKMLT